MAVPSTPRGVMGRSWPGERPSEYALTRAILGYAIALQCGGVVTACVAAAIDDGPGISRLWQLCLLGGLLVWGAFFTVTAVRGGLTLPLVICDVAVVALLLLAQPRLVPVTAVVDETTWAIMLAATTVYVALLATGRSAGLLLSSAVIIAYVVGVPAHTSQIRALVVQALAVSAIMWLLRRGGRRADAVVADRDRERQRAMVDAARRADERQHRSQMHDSVLATLTMVASRAVREDSPGLRRDARRAIEVLEMFSGDSVGGGGSPVDLAERLGDVFAEPYQQVGVDLSVDSGPDGSGFEVPDVVASAIISAIGEALRNVARHSGVSQARVHAERRDGSVLVTVSDEGCGFELVRVPGARRGIRYSIVERMTLVGGSATVSSRPGAGTGVVLRWPRG